MVQYPAILSPNENGCISIHFDSAGIHKMICITLETILTWFTMAKRLLRRRLEELPKGLLVTRCFDGNSS